LLKNVGALGAPLILDEATKKITLCHFFKVLIEFDLTLDSREIILVEMNDFDFYADVKYEKLPSFSNSC